MDQKAQLSFISRPYGDKYKSWARGVDEMYNLYENDFADHVEELTVFQYRITRNKKKRFDWYPMGRKLFNHQTKKWHTIPVSSLKKYLN